MDEPLKSGDFVAMRDRAPEFLADLMQHTIDVMTEGGVGREKAEVFAVAVVLRLRARWSKQLIYFAEGRSIDLRSRNRRIFAEFTGRNQEQLAAKYGVSVVWIRQIIALMRSEHAAERQRDLDLE